MVTLCVKFSDTETNDGVSSVVGPGDEYDSADVCNLRRAPLPQEGQEEKEKGKGDPGAE